jgi:hypothetical protein
MSKSTKEKLQIPTIVLMILCLGAFLYNLWSGVPLDMGVAALNVAAIAILSLGLRELYTP